MRRLVLAATLAVASQVLVSLPVGAQDRDLRSLIDRVDRMERDINQLQRQVYRGSVGGAPVPVSPVPADGNPALNTEMRLDQLESQMRTLTGSVEEVTYNIDQLKRRLDKLASDVDYRLTQLEHGTPATGAAASGAAPEVAAEKTGPHAAGPSAGAANPAAPASQSGILGTLPAGSGAQTASREAPAGTGGALPTGTPQEQYNYAFGLLRQADYAGAERALRSFIQRYPNDPLAGNAEYWLGETYYVRKDYNDAAATFAEGYRKYPRSGKGADNLLKLGMSLGNVGQKKEACLTFNQLAHDFPNASANVKERTAQEKQRLGC